MLDVGCGTGRLLEAAAQCYPLVVGLDPCLEMLDVARARSTSPGTGLMCAMAERLPFGTGTFDVVTSTLSLRHWKDPTLGLEELARVLSKTGTMVIADAPPDPWPVFRRRLRKRRETGGRLRQIAVRGGLTVIDERIAPSLFAVQVLTACHQRPRAG